MYDIVNFAFKVLNKVMVFTIFSKFVRIFTFSFGDVGAPGPPPSLPFYSKIYGRSLKFKNLCSDQIDHISTTSNFQNLTISQLLIMKTTIMVIVNRRRLIIVMMLIFCLVFDFDRS